MMVKIHFDENGHAIINDNTSFDGQIFKQSSNAARLENLEKSSFCHIDLDVREPIIEFRFSLKKSRFVSLFFNNNCLFAIRYDGTVAEKHYTSYWHHII